MKCTLFLILTLCLFLNSGCGDDNCEDTGKFEAQLHVEYTNSMGGDPNLSESTNQSSSEEINIINPVQEDEVNGRIFLNYPAVTFKNDKDVFTLKDIRLDRKTEDDCWIQDDENSLTFEVSKSLDIVLVLDVSSSLGDNIKEVKESSEEMVDIILDENPAAKIAVVKFSRGNVETQFSSDRDMLQDFIGSETTFDSPNDPLAPYTLEGRNETGLYEAINKAITILNNSNADGKGILTFTDGVSNHQFDPTYQNSEEIIEEMESLNIANYTIGFEGNQSNIDKAALESIAINGDFSFPQDINQLKEIFEKFSNNVAAVYDIVYETNNSPLEEPLSLRFLFDIEKIN